MVELKIPFSQFKALAKDLWLTSLYENREIVGMMYGGAWLYADKPNGRRVFKSSYKLLKVGYSGVSGRNFE